MKIRSITLWRVELASKTPYYMSDGKACETVDSTLVRLEADGGAFGWGEICPIPRYLPAYARGVAPAIEEIAPALLGAPALGPEAAMARADAELQDHRYAKSALDIAFWDLAARVADMPLHTLLGGRRAETLPLYHSITCVDPDEMARIAREAQTTGMTQFQVKLGADQNWEADVARVRRVREAVGPGPLVYCDWNCGATRLQATRTARAIADLDVMIEQPCATLEDCAAVRAATGLAIKIDELAHDAESLLKAHALGCLDAVAVKTSKFGGISAARRARDLCLHLGAEMCIEDVWGSDVTTAAAIHLGAATDPKRVLNVCDLAEYVTPRLDASAPVRRDGRIAPPEGPGLGVAPDPEALGAPLAVFD